MLGALSVAQALTPSLTVHFFDVNQGDATLFMGDDFTLLVDAGRHDRSELVGLLQQAGVSSIDLFILTHPHADHIGQCEGVMRGFGVRQVWMSGDVHTSRTFERCIDAVLDSDAYYHEPRAGETFELGSATIEIVHPTSVNGDYNDGSIGFRLIYGEVSFLLTGDAESDSERAMIARGHTLKADILHLGHHGSSTSSTLPFLQTVDPDMAIYSAGTGNSYGHPHREVVQRLAALSIPLYGTDTHGTVTILTDGSAYVVQSQRGEGPSGIASVTEAPNACSHGQVNVNAASAGELTQIVNIGSVLAQRIVDARPFTELDDLLRVSGIGAARLADIEAQGLACVGPYN